MFNIQFGRPPVTRTIQIQPAWLLGPLGMLGCILIGLSQGYFQSVTLALLLVGAGGAALWFGLVVLRPEFALLVYALVAVNLNGVDLPMSFGGLRLSPDILLTSLLIPGALLRALQTRRPLVNLPISASYLLFLAVPTLTLIWTPVLSHSLKGLFRFFGYYALMWLIIDVIRSREQVMRMIAALLLSPVIPIGIAFYQAVSGTGQIIWSDETYNRVYGLAGGPFTLAFYLVLLIPLLLIFFLGDSEGESAEGVDTRGAPGWIFHRPLLALIMAGSLVALMLTYIRGSWLSLVAALLVLGFLRGSLRFRQLLFSIPATAISVAVAYEPIRTRIANLFIGSVSVNVAVNPESTLTGRMLVWQFAWEWVTSSPLNFLVGLGMKAFEFYYTLLSGPRTGVSLYWRRASFLVGNRPHNEIIGFMLDAGFIGTVALIVSIVIVVKIALHVYHHNPDLTLRLIALAFLISAAGMVLGAMGDNTFSQPTVAVYFWMMAALIMAINRHLTPEIC